MVLVVPPPFVLSAVRRMTPINGPGEEATTMPTMKTS
jgi:hypothetical protein